jgi:hypothetical protein
VTNFQKSRTSNRGLHDVGGPSEFSGTILESIGSCGTRIPYTQYHPFRKLLSFLKILDHITSHPSLWIYSFVQLASIHTPLLQRSNQEKFQLPTKIPYPISRVGYNPPPQSSQGATKKSTMVQTAPPSQEAETQNPKIGPTNNNKSISMSSTYDFCVSGVMSSGKTYYDSWIGVGKGGGRKITDH